MLANLKNEGRISVDRDTWVTLRRTIPRSVFKSSTKDLSLPTFELILRHCLAYSFIVNSVPSPYYDLGPLLPEAYTHSCGHQGKHIIATFQHGFWLRGVQP